MRHEYSHLQFPVFCLQFTYLLNFLKKFIYIYKKRLLMPWMFICSHYIQQFYDTVVTAIIA